MEYIKRHKKELTAGFVSFAVGVLLVLFSGGFAKFQAAQSMEKYVESVPILEKKMIAFEGLIQDARIKDSLQILFLQKKIDQDNRQDELILGLYKYLKLYPPDMERIKTPQRIN